MDILFILLSILALIIGIAVGKLLGKIKIHKKPSKLTPAQKRIKIAVITATIAIALILIDIFTPFWGGQIRFYAKWITCEHVPFKGVKESYPVDSYIRTPIVDLFRNNRTDYFCTAKEAELAGLSNNSYSYDYPNLSVEERQSLFDKPQ